MPTGMNFLYKICFACLVAISFVSQAASPAYFDFTSGVLTLPFVNTQQSAFSAELKIDPNLTSASLIRFNLTKVSTLSGAFDANQTPHFDFTTGLLTLPIVTTLQGSYSGVMSIAQASTKSAALHFNLIKVNPYVAPKLNKVKECTVFPADNVWNTPVNSLPVHSRSTAWINAIGYAKSVHLDFGADEWEGGTIGIPYNIVAGSTVSKSKVAFLTSDESDAGPYPIPEDYKIEFASDHHLLIIDTETCQLFELYNAGVNRGWTADSGAIWTLNSNQLRRSNWTSADAAGLPIFPGLVRYDEVAFGFIGHAIRFTIPSSSSYVWPARHLTAGMQKALSDTPPLGARFRLKANYPINGFAPELRVILKAMQTYGVISADHGSGWFVSGAPDERWNDDVLKKLQVLKGSDFEAVDTSCMIINSNSAQADLSKCPSYP
jgi:hypothetical protein